jgi:FkbH-like protein
MKLIDALDVIKRPVSGTAPAFDAFLACGFTPLHLQTFLAAELRLLQGDCKVSIQAGLFGDLVGNITKAQRSGVNALLVAIEWTDLDPRLGTRSLGGWRPDALPDIERSVSQAVARIKTALIEAATVVPTVVSMPTLPLPPLFWTQPEQGGASEMRLRHTVATLAATLAQQPGIRLLNPQVLDELSPLSGRFDIKSELAAGFPYTLVHASSLAKQLATLAVHRAPKKALITDLDDTLWAGILGEDGVDGISWTLDHHSQIHGLYQQLLAALAGAGVLVGVASKNDPGMVERAFNRSDLLLPKADVFPVEAHWSPKSESIKRILEVWNIAPDAVVFVDDSPMEVAEVNAAFPDVECIVFPKDDPRAFWEFLKRLRTAFGKTFLTEDDALRLASIRNAEAWRTAAAPEGGSTDDFLKAAQASILFESDAGIEDKRAFELINKTNQFNLNGKRLDEAEWRKFFEDPRAFLVTASYEDKFGRLGKIAALMGTIDGPALRITAWVMSCRAFSRRIEHQFLKSLFDAFAVEEIVFDFEKTPRNGPVQDFLSAFVNESSAPLILSREVFDRNTPPLFHRVEGVNSGAVSV